MSQVNLTKDLEAKVRAAFYILMQSCTEVKSYDVPHFNGIREDALRYMSDINNPTDLSSHRNTIIDALRKLYTMKAYFNLADEWTGFNTLYQAATESDSKPVEVKALFREHINKVTESHPKKELDVEALCNWMSCIPLRMTTAKYHDYIADAVKALPMPINMEYAEDFKRLFNPKDYTGNESWLRDIKNELDNIWENEGTIRENTESLRNINMKLIQLTTYASILFDVLCASGIIQKATAMGFDLLDTPQAKDLYEAYQSTIQKPELDDSFLEQTDKAIEDAMKGIQYEKDTKLYTHDFDKETKTLYEAWRPIHNLYYETAFDYFTYFSVPDSSTQKDIPAFMEALQAFIDTATKELDGKHKRFLRQHFLRYLPYPYSLEVYRTYFLETYESLDDTNRLLLAALILIDSQDKEDA